MKSVYGLNFKNLIDEIINLNFDQKIEVLFAIELKDALNRRLRRRQVRRAYLKTEPIFFGG